MNNQFKYKLDPGPKKYHCPRCNQRRFVRYIDEGGQYLPEQYGRCDREVNCGYHLNPYEEKFGIEERKDWQPLPPPPPRPPDFIPDETMRLSFRHYQQNNFVQWLIQLIGIDAEAAVNRYQIGTSKHWPGATVFWQIDEAGRVHSGKILLYNPTTGKRVKDNQGAKIGWVHKALNIENFNLQQCYFGLHLLHDNKPIALCESEKTAILASVYIPGFTWLAAGGRNMLNNERFKPLKERRVILFPDGDSFEHWSAKAGELQKVYPGTRITVSDLIEKHCTPEERLAGVDLCDLLIRLQSEKVNGLIREQWQNLNPDLWYMNPERFPVLTRYNLKTLAEDLLKYEVNITPAEYQTRFNQIMNKF